MAKRDVSLNNSEAVQASNGLIGGSIIDTLNGCACVLGFISEFHCRKPAGELTPEVEAGLVYVVDHVLDAIEKQSKEMQADHD